MTEEKTALDRAAELVLLEFAPLTRVRITRAVIYEGSYSRVSHLLQNSLSVADYGVKGREGIEGSLSICVRQCEVEVLGEDRLAVSGKNNAALKARESLSSLSTRELVESHRDECKKAVDKYREEHRANGDLQREVLRLEQEVERLKATVSRRDVQTAEDIGNQLAKGLREHMDSVLYKAELRYRSFEDEIRLRQAMEAARGSS